MKLHVAGGIIVWFLAIRIPLSLSLASLTTTTQTRFAIAGGTGRIGTAVAIHLLTRDSKCEVILVGRNPGKAASAKNEVLSDSGASPGRVSVALIDSVWKESPKFQELIDSVDCFIHTAGPYLDQQPIPLKVAIQSSRCRAYVDVSDPVDYLEQSLEMSQEAKDANITALIASGAFPGMSNVLAMEAAGMLGGKVQDVRFNYFTAGLGGSGTVNLYITNLGFGEPMVQYDRGELRWFKALSGLILGKVDFFLPSTTPLFPANEIARERIGRQTVFAWPFPEAATVAKHLNARGNSYAAMVTAPDIWNSMLGVLVNLVPRSFWKSVRFSKFMADFSEPLVLVTDALLQRTGTGETHAMRVDVTSCDDQSAASVVQCHDSFRRCVGQSCAEFALDLILNPRPGVYLPEEYYSEAGDRSQIVSKLTSTPGTFCYTSPVRLEQPPDLPTDWSQALERANKQEGTTQ